MTTLQKISRFIAESNLSENEIHEILVDYTTKRAEYFFGAGWLKRDRLQRLSKQASEIAARRNLGHEQDLAFYDQTDYTQPLSPWTLIRRGDDVVSVKHLRAGDVVEVRGETLKILEVREDSEKVILKMR